MLHRYVSTVAQNGQMALEKTHFTVCIHNRCKLRPIVLQTK